MNEASNGTLNETFYGALHKIIKSGSDENK